MAKYTQDNRALQVSTPLGKDKLLAVGLSGNEAISQLFSFQLDLLAEKQTEVAFDKLLGQPVTTTVLQPGGKKRYFSGICHRVSQGEQDATFTAYRLEIVPQFWLLTKRSQSRIFQQISVPDILKKVLTGLDVTYELQGSFEKRDYCVQYRESDFNFASRLMQEEGIYYFFKHDASGHKMVVANSPQSHADLGKIVYEQMEEANRRDDRIHDWAKVQELRSGKVTLWDHSFELPHQHLDADKTIQETVAAGKASHKFKVGGNDKLEVYDYPGAYAQRFDGIDKGGSEQPAELQKIFQDNRRTVEIRMQQEAAEGLVIQGAGNSRQLASGHKFTLEKHFNADGVYVLTSVQHMARLAGAYRSDEESFTYHNSFTCIPEALPYRPPRVTPRPVVQGTQTAVVVGPSGEEIFTDKYGRVKVQFHWDREGKKDANSSCWIRVASFWAGKQWGAIHIPRIDQEVVVDFLEGDPDQPIIVGSVYNAEMMPPYKLPDNKTQSGIKSRSSLKGTPDHYNEIRFEDKKGSEKITIHAEHDMSQTVEHNETIHVYHNRTITTGGSKHNTDPKKDGTHTETIEGDAKYTIQKGDYALAVQTGKMTTTVKQNIAVESTDADILLKAKTQIKLECGASTITMKSDGTIDIKGTNITVNGTASVSLASLKIDSVATGVNTIKGGPVKINC